MPFRKLTEQCGENELQCPVTSQYWISGKWRKVRLVTHGAGSSRRCRTPGKGKISQNGIPTIFRENIAGRTLAVPDMNLHEYSRVPSLAWRR